MYRNMSISIRKENNKVKEVRVDYTGVKGSAYIVMKGRLVCWLAGLYRKDFRYNLYIEDGET